MLISVRCGGCGNNYQVDDKAASVPTLCEQCRAGVAPAAAIQMPPVQEYQTPPQVAPEISKARKLAGRSFILLAVLQLLFATCLGAVLLFAVAGAAGAPVVANVVLAVFFFGMLLFAAAGLITGIMIRRGGQVAVIVGLVIAGIEELVALLTLAGSIIQVITGKGPGTFIGLGISVLMVAAFAQLIYYLVKILLEPRALIR